MALTTGPVSIERRHRVTHRRMADDFHLHHIPGLQWTDPGWSTRQHDVARLQCDVPADVREQDGDRERQFRGAAALLLLAVQPSDDDERSKVSWPARLRAERQKGVAPFRARPLAVVLLPFARRHVVGRDDAAYGGRTLLVRRFSEPRADHDPHLALEIHAP